MTSIDAPPDAPASPPTAAQILAHVQSNFTAGQRRKFLPGLLIAFINFLRELDATGGKYATPAAFYEAFPRQTHKPDGRVINTLSVKVGTGTKSIRKHYDAIANWFRSDQKRFDFPSSAPHATQAWADYPEWLPALLSFSDVELAQLESDTKAFVLASLPSQAIDPASIKREPPMFLMFLEDFDMKAKKGEITGAAYQGTVFGYIRADAPHLQVEVGKVRTGSKREKRVGDIDARDGSDLVLSAEVKQYKVSEDTLPDLGEFANLIAQHKALGLVVALDFEDGIAEQLKDMGLQPISQQDLVERVRVWDPLKQKIAMSAILYYVAFREQNSALYGRIKDFLSQLELTARAD